MLIKGLNDDMKGEQCGCNGLVWRSITARNEPTNQGMSLRVCFHIVCYTFSLRVCLITRCKHRWIRTCHHERPCDHPPTVSVHWTQTPRTPTHPAVTPPAHTPPALTTAPTRPPLRPTPLSPRSHPTSAQFKRVRDGPLEEGSAGLL